MTQNMEPLVRRIWQEVEATIDIVAGHHVQMPDIVETDPRPNEGRFADSFPVLKHLDQALKLAKSDKLTGLAEAISDALPRFRWSQNGSYNETNCSRAFLDGYAYAGLSGPDTSLSWAAPRTGVFLMAPDLLYPGHNHPAREIYLILTPGAEWRLDNGDWFKVQAGDLIFHDSWVLHEMRTFETPMLAIAAWIEDGARDSICWGSKSEGGG